jgi:hypothetical protein
LPAALTCRVRVDSLSALLTGTLAAQSVHVVDSIGAGDFPDLASATAASLDEPYPAFNVAEWTV